MEPKDLKSLAVAVASHFALQTAEASNTKSARQERVGLLFATIKRDAPQMSDGERVALVYAFGVECGKAGMSSTTIAARRSDLQLLLDNSSQIEDGANAWRPVVDAIRRSKLSARKLLETAIENAEKAVTAAKERLADLQSELVGLEHAETIGTV